MPRMISIRLVAEAARAGKADLIVSDGSLLVIVSCISANRAVKNCVAR